MTVMHLHTNGVLIMSISPREYPSGSITIIGRTQSDLINNMSRVIDGPYTAGKVIHRPTGWSIDVTPATPDYVQRYYDEMAKLPTVYNVMVLGPVE